MKSSRVLARLEHETRLRHAAADNDRLGLITSQPTPDVYRRFLSRIYGFESPVESAVALTPGVDDVFDLRGRTSTKLLRSDLVALGVIDPSQLPRCTSVFPFRSAADALGWVYVLERNAMLHGIVRRHLETRLPEVLVNAGAYLAGNDRAAGARMRELGQVLDEVASTDEITRRIVDAANAAYRCQLHWSAGVVPLRRQVA